MSVTLILPTVPERADLLAQCWADWKAQTIRPDYSLVGRDDEHRGPAVIRNELVMDAASDWVTFADDDDRFYPQHLETLLATQAETGADVVWTRCKVVGEPNHWTPMHRCPPRLGQIPVTTLVRRDAFLTVGGFPDQVRYEDRDLFAALHAAGFKFQCSHEVTWEYHFHSANRSRVELQEV